MKFAEAGMEIVTNLDPNLGKIKADREKLVQALINILLNALEASGYGAKIRIRYRFRIVARKRHCRHNRR